MVNSLFGEIYFLLETFLVRISRSLYVPHSAMHLLRWANI